MADETHQLKSHAVPVDVVSPQLIGWIVQDKRATNQFCNSLAISGIDARADAAVSDTAIHRKLLLDHGSKDWSTVEHSKSLEDMLVDVTVSGNALEST